MPSCHRSRSRGLRRRSPGLRWEQSHTAVEATSMVGKGVALLFFWRSPGLDQSARLDGRLIPTLRSAERWHFVVGRRWLLVVSPWSRFWQFLTRCLQVVRVPWLFIYLGWCHNGKRIIFIRYPFAYANKTPSLAGRHAGWLFNRGSVPYTRAQKHAHMLFWTLASSF